MGVNDNKRAQSAKLKRIDLSYAKVLVVDDMVTNLDVAKGMMKPYGLHVDCVTSGREAIKIITAGHIHYNAVFMDHMMPGMDGIEAARIIREEIGTEYAKTVPLIALTANAITGNEEMFLGCGFQAFISKPIDMIRLDSILRRWVRDKDREKEHEPESGALNTISCAKQEEHSIRETVIDGLNIEKGISRFSGNEEIYKSVLQSYAVNTRPLLVDIEKYLSLEDLPNYAVTVHGIKGSSYGIGALRVGARAERLELLAKAGKKEQVLAKNGDFTEDLKRLLDSVDKLREKYNSKTKKPSMTTPDPELLGELKEACMEYDVDRVDKAMLKLESFEYETGKELVSWLHGQVEEMQFKEISEGAWPSADVKAS